MCRDIFYRCLGTSTTITPSFGRVLSFLSSRRVRDDERGRRGARIESYRPERERRFRGLSHRTEDEAPCAGAPFLVEYRRRCASSWSYEFHDLLVRCVGFEQPRVEEQLRDDHRSCGVQTSQ
jgi:hypothetical protein